MNEDLVPAGFDLAAYADPGQTPQIHRCCLSFRNSSVHNIVDPAIGLLKDCLHKCVAVHLRQLVQNESLCVPPEGPESPVTAFKGHRFKALYPSSKARLYWSASFVAGS